MSGSDKQKRSNGNKQSDILVVVALLLLAAVFLYVGFSQPKVSNDYTVTPSETQVYSPEFDSTALSNSSTAQASSSESYGAQEVTDIAVHFPINLNTCTRDELMAIDGIGETRADSILAYREQLGGYTSVEQLKEISGIGDTLYAKIAPYVTV